MNALARGWLRGGSANRLANPHAMSSGDSEVLAQQVSGINVKVAGLERRMAEVEKVNGRLEQAAPPRLGPWRRSPDTGTRSTRRCAVPRRKPRKHRTLCSSPT